VKLSWESYQSPLKLFRSQRVKTDELENMKNNIGGFISFAQFLSTSKDQNVVEAFAGHPSDDPTTIPILFHIQIHFKLDTFPESGIANFSSMGSDEDQFLFTMTSIFRIKKIEEDYDQLWHIHLLFFSDNHRKLGKLTEQMEKNDKSLKSVNSLCTKRVNGIKLFYSMRKRSKTKQIGSKK